MPSVTETDRRDWDWEKDGELDGLYVETRSVIVKNGPSAGKTKIVFDFHLAKNDESVSVWEAAVLKSAFKRELKARRKPDFEPGERVAIRPTGMKTGVNGQYRDFDVDFGARGTEAVRIRPAERRRRRRRRRPGR